MQNMLSISKLNFSTTKIDNMGNNLSHHTEFDSKKTESVKKVTNETTNQNEEHKTLVHNRSEALDETIKPVSKESTVLLSIQQELDNQSDLESDDEANQIMLNTKVRQQFTQPIAYFNQDVRSIRSDKKLFTDDYFKPSMDILFDCSAKTNIFARHLCEKLGVHAYNTSQLDVKIKWQRSPVSFKNVML
jgi:hypothetical protein